jgi:Flp pilus assembly protein TadD
MHSVRTLPLVLTLLLAACGGQYSEHARKEDDAVAQAALNAGTPGAALELADATLKKHPGDIDALIHRGLAMTELGRLDEARQTLRQAVTLQPRNEQALLALGRVQLPVDPAGAEANFESALKQNSVNAAALNDLGIARDLQGHHVDAEAAYRAAITAQPNMTAARVNLALCLAIRGQGGEAIRLMQPLANAPEATLKVKQDYAAVLAMAGKREEAQNILAANLPADEVARALDALTLARIAPASETQASAAPVSPIIAAETQAPVRVTGGNDTPAASDHVPTVQLGALDSEAAAQDKWQQLSQRFPNLLNGKQPIFSQTKRDGHTFWRVRTSGFADVAQARSFCDRLHTAGDGCAVFDF